jgi:phosphoglycolate phosphatase-like HAD superfamily hydrolase/GNAT superfamily N-acetyltransferase
MTLELIAFDLGHTLMREGADGDVPIERRPIHLMPGVEKALGGLAHPLALWTNTGGARQDEVRAWLDRTGFGHRFDWVITSPDAGYRKPAPEFFAYALSRCGIAKDEVLFVCNQLNTDVAGAEAVGIRTVWLSDDAYRSRDDEACEARPTYSIPTLSDLPDLIRRISITPRARRADAEGAIRSAVASDAERLFDLRRASVLELAPPAMRLAAAEEWANAHGPEWILQILRDRLVWVYETGGEVVGWVSVTANTIDGLYTSPRHARQGIGTRLLQFVEAELERLGYAEATLEASVNAEAFYRRRGYEAAGPRPRDGEALRMSKELGPRADC